MKKCAIWLCACASLMGCGGGSGVEFLGSVFVEPDETGAVEGVMELSRVDSSVGSFVYGYDTGLRALDFQDNATTADRANYAYSGVLPGAQVGDIPLTGTAQFVGAYEVVTISGYNASSNPANWTEARDSGAMTVDVDFEEGQIDGRSDDGQLMISYFGTPTDDPATAALSSRLFGEVTFQGIAGSFKGQIGGNGIIGAMNGQDDTSFFAGGFFAEDD
ncbi:MAG: hypothetical protein AAFP98_02920 [Pseudomonadota bacterium]